MQPTTAQTGETFRTEADRRWAAVLGRDTSFDGAFVYAVNSTGVYCRPGCPSRRPKRENVTFYADVASAAAAGFRACKRCHPDRGNRPDDRMAAIERACRTIETAEALPGLAELAAAAGLSPHHFHRLFKAATGLTPKGYASAHRGRRIREALGSGVNVTEALYAGGFQSSSRFYAAAAAMLGMSPTAYRRKGAGATIMFAVGQCSLGAVLVARSDEGICAVLLGDDPETLVGDLQDRFANAEIVGGDRDFDGIVARVVALVERPAGGLDLPLDIRGTAFQQRVWDALRQIPAGTTATYAEIAARIGEPKAIRAVASACGANPIAVAIPCHRVVRRDGSLAGYRWGVERKRALLAAEAAGDER